MIQVHRSSANVAWLKTDAPPEGLHLFTCTKVEVADAHPNMGGGQELVLTVQVKEGPAAGKSDRCKVRIPQGPEAFAGLAKDEKAKAISGDTAREPFFNRIQVTFGLSDAEALALDINPQTGKAIPQNVSFDEQAFVGRDAFCYFSPGNPSAPLAQKDLRYPDFQWLTPIEAEEVKSGKVTLQKRTTVSAGAGSGPHNPGDNNTPELTPAQIAAAMNG